MHNGVVFFKVSSGYNLSRSLQKPSTTKHSSGLLKRLCWDEGVRLSGAGSCHTDGQTDRQTSAQGPVQLPEELSTQRNDTGRPALPYTAASDRGRTPL